MSDRIDLDTMSGMLLVVVARIRAARNELAALDSAIGDGDHGAAMGKVADAIERCIGRVDSKRLADLLSKIGWAIMGIDAGSTGPLYGSLFLGMSEGSVDADGLDAAGLAVAFEQGVAKLRKHSQAAPGDKTMIDALVPAVGALQTAAGENRSTAEALAAAASAAEQGAKRTACMRAAFGRAKNLGERSIGHVDPGAASVSIVFAALKEGLAHA
jgi:dihydroxyacetone kinase-like protein